MHILLLDNLDSFTYNLAHLLGAMENCDISVVRTDAVTLTDLKLHKYDCVVVSPGPGHPAVPRDFRLCREVILSASLPVLGVCLGHQGIAHYMGGSVIRARQPMHGRVAKIHHSGKCLFRGLANPFKAVRYHSLIVASNLPPDLEVTAWTEEGEIMGIAHRQLPLWGVQFHPESICTEHGDLIAQNFRDLVIGWRKQHDGRSI